MVRRVDQPTFNKGIAYLPFFEDQICLKWWLCVIVDVPQFILACDVHPDDLRPEGIIHADQFDANCSDNIVIGADWSWTSC